ncbi:sulfatase-like hydrolase/transferase [Ruania alkalisoli]|uniref:Sulfatase-like hydrolase/transferase n=1 Tax=Ruania alkalisoli TaxID=2779775 RepID=A0A7M1SV17_9MICO|nr:sulfatase-like hydrolase/transferase [Ruania alkalisoli]QOR71430.1 sulfatase-like hydrolase/transferase [Ruania alkalisoli]
MPPSTAQPNILWLVSEDNSRYLGCYGDPVAHTPRLDALAAEGIRYDQAYAVAPVCAPSRFSIITGMYPWSVPGAEHMRANVDLPPHVHPFTAYLRQVGYYCTNASKTDYNAKVSIEAAWDQCSEDAHWRDRAPGQPFFSVVNFMETHESCLFDGHDQTDTDPGSVRVPAYLPDTATVRADLAHYYDHMSRLDDQIGTVLDEIERDGLSEDTIVVYYADHGGVQPRSKRFCYDSGLAVPLLVHVPERWRAHAAADPGPSAEAITLMDLPATVLSLAGIRPPDHLHGRAALGPHRRPAPTLVFGGRSRMDERYDLQRTVRDHRFRYLRNYQPCLPAGQHLGYMWQQQSVQEWEELARTGDLPAVQRTFWEHKHAEALYDLQADPDEVHNLAGDPRHADIRDRLSASLDDHMREVGDTGFLLEGSFEPLGDGDLGTLMTLAATVARHEPVPSGEHATHPHSAIRAWAARAAQAALTCPEHPGIDAALREEHQRTLELLVHDPVPGIRIIALEAVADEAAIGHLIALLGHDDEPVRLQSANALDRLAERGRIPTSLTDRLTAALTAPTATQDRYLPRIAEHMSRHLGAAGA